MIIKSTELARMRGRRIAAAMLLELRTSGTRGSIGGANPQSLFAEYRYKGEPQDNIVLRYLQRATRHGAECIAGFCSVLSDHCANVEAGGPSFRISNLRATNLEISRRRTTRQPRAVLCEANHTARTALTTTSPYRPARVAGFFALLPGSSPRVPARINGV